MQEVAVGWGVMWCFEWVRKEENALDEPQLKIAAARKLGSITCIGGPGALGTGQMRERHRCLTGEAFSKAREAPSCSGHGDGETSYYAAFLLFFMTSRNLNQEFPFCRHTVSRC